jgi:hypothetical protein
VVVPATLALFPIFLGNGLFITASHPLRLVIISPRLALLLAQVLVTAVHVHLSE